MSMQSHVYVHVLTLGTHACAGGYAAVCMCACVVDYEVIAHDCTRKKAPCACMYIYFVSEQPVIDD